MLLITDNDGDHDQKVGVFYLVWKKDCIQICIGN